MATTDPLWAVLIHGPDDLIPVVSCAEAAIFALETNVNPPPGTWAEPVRWPHSPESHAAELARLTDRWEQTRVERDWLLAEADDDTRARFFAMRRDAELARLTQQETDR